MHSAPATVEAMHERTPFSRGVRASAPVCCPQGFGWMLVDSAKSALGIPAAMEEALQREAQEEQTLMEPHWYFRWKQISSGQCGKVQNQQRKNG